MRTAPVLRTSGIPPNLATRSGLFSRLTLASKHVRGPWGVSVLALYFAAILATVDWCLAAVAK